MSWVRQFFPGTRLDVDGRPRGHYLQASFAHAGDTISGRIRWGVDSDGLTPAMPTLSTGVVLDEAVHLTPGGPPSPRSSSRVRSQARTFTVGQTWSWVTGAALHARYGPGAQFGLLQVPMQRLAEAAEALTGVPGTTVRILEMAARSPAAQRYWAHLMALTHRDLTSPDPTMLHPLIGRHWQQTLASAALQVFPNTTLTAASDHLGGPGAVGPATVRRALAHAEAHAHEPLGVADLARAAGIGVRALQVAYAQHVGQTPTAHLRQVRLRRAHAELSVASPPAADGSGTTVTAVAARWGFTPGAFATAYRAQFGCSPSTTLRG